MLVMMVWWWRCFRGGGGGGFDARGCQPAAAGEGIIPGQRARREARGCLGGGAAWPHFLPGFFHVYSWGAAVVLFFLRTLSVVFHFHLVIVLFER